jgi:integrase/recombinase XerD
MTSKNTFSILFWINRTKENKGKAPIYARVTVDLRRVEISIKRRIEPENWNAEKGIAKGIKEEIKSLNAYIENVRNRLFDCYQDLVNKHKFVTAEAIKDRFIGVDEKEHSLMTVIDYHNEEMTTTLEWGTLKNYFTTKKYVEIFLKDKYKTSDVYLYQLNYKFLTDFERFLKTYQPKDHHKPIGQNTVMKHIERLRKIVNLCIKNEWLDRDPFQKFKPSFIKTSREFLTADELATIENKNVSFERLQLVKDIFIFSCYTGLAYIDVFNLTTQNIALGIDGDYWLSTSRKKTEQPVRIPLLPKPMAIIEKYKNNPRALAHNKLFPSLSNQKLNSYLKEIADLCGITKPLTFHIARHTFATTVTLTNGVPIETVSSMLGHTSIKTTQIYAKVIQQKVSNDMKALREKMDAQQVKQKEKSAS